jgi:hypothetical protein
MINKSMLLIWTLALLIVSVSMPGASQASTSSSKSCTITCEQKTPTCYVTQEKSGCLVISNDKPPTRNKGSYTCVIEGCDIKTTYDGQTGGSAGR